MNRSIKGTFEKQGWSTLCKDRNGKTVEVFADISCDAKIDSDNESETENLKMSKICVQSYPKPDSISENLDQDELLWFFGSKGIESIEQDAEESLLEMANMERSYS